MRCMIWYHLYNLKNVKNTHRGVLLLVKFQALLSYFEYLTTNKLISDNQSDFKPGNSCINQLLSITHEIYHSLDES